MHQSNSTSGLAPWLFISLLLIFAVVLSSGDRENDTSSAGLYWSSTADEETDLLHKPQPDDASIVNDIDHFDGGFSSLDGMLQWAIGHSDPAKLKDASEDTRRLTPSELQSRQAEIKELIEKLKVPSDADLMKRAINDLKNVSLSLEDRHRALEEILELVQPIDNTNDFSKLGGLGVVIGELSHPDPDTRRISAWILGTACQNNPSVQDQVLELGALATLIKMVNSSFVEEGVKAFYAVSALIRNNLAGQETFYAEAGGLLLQDILSNSSVDIRLRKKAVFIVGDLAEYQLESKERPDHPFLSNRFFLKAVVDLTDTHDLDLQEKALVALKSLIWLNSTEALVLRDFCGLEEALEGMRLRLHDLMADEDYKDYAADVENIRREVELSFHRKLTGGMEVPSSNVIKQLS